MPDRVKEKLVDVHSKLMGLLQRAPYIRCEDVHRQYAVNWLMNNGVTVQEWIPVTERLPEVGVRVMIFDSYLGVSIGKVVDRKWWSGKIELVAEVDELDYNEITHWMPLPQPPKP